ncbi:MAG: hypothetical protein EAZ95_07110 [Bacteroidetes bacterium]|nr:MAG: hypothetical protein EAZ95_07110 [Bacteroidota bacterium]
MLKILETNPTEASFSAFQNLPALLYPQDSAKFRLPDAWPTEWLDSCFVVLENDVPVARASLYLNPYLQYEGRQVACVGTYEAQEDAKYAQMLLQHIENTAKAKGATFLVGQMNGSTWENYRFSLHHDSPPFFLEAYHHLYYNAHFEKNGFEPIAYYFSSVDKSIKHNSPEALEAEAHFQQKGVTLRTIDINRYEEELARVHAFNLLAYQTNFLYSPIAEDAFMRKYAPLKQLINPDLVVFAEDAEGNLIGYLFGVQDFWNKETKTLIAKSVARHPDKQWRGLGLVIGNQVCKNALKHAYKHIIHSFLRENGTSVGLSQTYSGEVFRRYALYGKAL